MIGQPTPGAGVDVVDAGVVSSGPVTFARYDDSTKFKFTITGSNGSVASILADVTKDALSYDWLQSLVRARQASLRIADTRDMVPGTTNRDTAKRIAVCSRPQPEDRSDRLSFFSFDCVVFDETKLIIDDKGTPWLGLIIVVYTPKGSATDTLLTKKREKDVVYVRLEDAGR